LVLSIGISWRRLLAGGTVLAAIAATSVVASAQTPDAQNLTRARDLFVEATAARDAGDLASALEKFKSAHDLAPNPITTVELGRTYAMRGMLLEARDTYLSVARIPVQPDETARATQSRQDAAKLADEATQQIDRIASTLAPPAPRETSSAAPAISLSVPPSAETARGHESGGIEPLAYVGFGVGVAGLVTGGILGFVAIDKATSAQNACNSTLCLQSAADDLQSAQTFGYASIVSLAIAGVGVAVGIVELVLSSPRTKTTCATGPRTIPWIAPGGAGLGGSF
jgi:hypothetical protein